MAWVQAVVALEALVDDAPTNLQVVALASTAVAAAMVGGR